VSLVDLSLVVDVLVADGVGIREAMRVPESEREREERRWERVGSRGCRKGNMHAPSSTRRSCFLADSPLSSPPRRFLVLLEDFVVDLLTGFLVARLFFF
jgi:hypothetical protein